MAKLELHIVAPGSYGAKDLYLWKMVITPLSGEIVPEDSLLELKATTGRFGSQKLTLKLMKSKKKRWYKARRARHRRARVSSGPEAVEPGEAVLLKSIG
ncbi:unnamed protein product [Effrenium voratum]|uniref:Uncharacterized protein n=1 Tax=Effrenium voratum TaxID=2562239 RepID=A0AA36NLU7_9DINO|nr:unnamed protein product [Effrenium voratum]